MAACEDCFDTGVNPWTNEECDSCDFSKPKRPRNKHLNYGKEHIALLTDLFAKGDSSDEVIIKNTQPANWITPQGVWKKQKEIEPRMPNIRFARFVTLTIDQSKYLDAEHAFEVGRRHLRQFFYDLDKGLGNAERTPYCWKLEFQENGWPHWHIILLYFKKLPLDLLNKCWGKGRTDVEMIRDTDFKYLFKYAAKGVGDLPQFILDTKQVRFFQTSKGFLTPKDTASPRLNNTEKEIIEELREMMEAYQRKESTLGERIDRWIRTLSISSNGFVGITDYEGWSYADILFQGAVIAASLLSSGRESDVEITSNKIITNKEKLCLMIKQ